MKSMLFSILFLLASSLGLAQANKIEVIQVGTKLIFYPDQCGNDIPEAQGKLTFCDNIGNLGVVEESYGLNYASVRKMLLNPFGEDELYLTDHGISIHNTNDTWENIPNVALPTWNNEQEAVARSGMMMPNNKVLILTSSWEHQLLLYDRSQKTIINLEMPSNIIPNEVVWDSDQSTAWILASTQSTKYLFSYNGTVLEQKATWTANYSTNGTPITYHQGHVYWGANTTGLFVVDLDNFELTNYNSESTVALPNNTIYGLQFDAAGILWLAQTASSEGCITRMDLGAGVVDTFRLQLENSNSHHRFKDLAIDPNGSFWCVSTNYNGMVKLSFSGGTPNWVQVPKSELVAEGVNFIYVPHHVSYANDKFYFMASSLSTGENNASEVLIYDGSNWTFRNDDQPGTPGFRAQDGAGSVLPSEDGGLWWLNWYHNIITIQTADDYHTSFFVDQTPPVVIDADQKPVSRSSTALMKIDFPDSHLFGEGDAEQGFAGLQRVGNQIWAIEPYTQKVYVYQYEVLVKTYDLPDTLNYYYDFSVDDELNIWLTRMYNGLFYMVKYNTDTESLTSIVKDYKFQYYRRTIPGPDNMVCFIGKQGVVTYKDGNFYPMMYADYPEFFNIVDAIFDENGQLYVLTHDNATFVKIENPASDSPTLTKTKIEGSGSIVPVLKHYRPGGIAIRNDGSIWTKASLNSFGIFDDDLAKQYTHPYAPDAINSFTTNEHINLSPNPTNGQVDIIADMTIKSISVFDAQGRKVFAQSSTTHLDLQKLKPGIYFVTIHGQHTSVTKKLVIE